MSSNYRQATFFVLGVVFLLVVFVAGVWFGFENRPAVEKITQLTNKEAAPSVEATTNFGPFWDTWELINERYVDGNATSSTSTVAVTDQEKVWGAIGGLVGSLGDPYSVFLPPAENKAFEEDIRGNFGGLGIEVGVRSGAITVIAPLPNTPAERAGIVSGDQIIGIDGRSTGRMSLDEAIGLIRGEVGTIVELIVRRASVDKPIELKLTREVISIPTIDTEMLAGDIFLIKLYNFGATSPDAFRNALREFAGTKSHRLILDLRNNPGGYLEAAVDIASWFLPAGRPVAIEYRGEGQEEKVYRSRGYDVFNDNLELVILVNGGSASASEILAGALDDYDLATLVGEKTFGKGSVQELIEITENTSLKLTVARWLTPSRRSISHEGLTPDVVVKESDEGDTETDRILAKAKEILLNR